MCTRIQAAYQRHNSKEMFQEIKKLMKTFIPKLNAIKDENGNTLIETRYPTAMEWCKGLCSDKSETEKHFEMDLRNGKVPGCDNPPAELLKVYGQSGNSLLRVHTHKLC